MARKTGPSAAALRHFRERQAARNVQADAMSKSDIPPRQTSGAAKTQTPSTHKRQVHSSQAMLIMTHLVTNKYPKFNSNEVSLGNLLGSGAFCSAWQINSFDVPLLRKRGSAPDLQREFLTRHCRASNGQTRFVLKKLKDEITNPSKNNTNQELAICRQQQGIADLHLELCILDKLNHPHILQLRGTVRFDDSQGLIVDRLLSTLEDRLGQWKTKLVSYSGLLGQAKDRKGMKRAALYKERLQTTVNLADALEYMHERNILYRDLKPENIGYDMNGQVKIFDFGLSKDLSKLVGSNPRESTYNLTEMSGSLRYMAPEVANGLPYNHSCDVYSFGIVFWQILTLKTPFEQYTPKSLREKVYNGPHKRPPIRELETTPEFLHQGLLEKCWHKNLYERPHMRHVMECLRQETGEIVETQSGTMILKPGSTPGSAKHCASTSRASSASSQESFGSENCDNEPDDEKPADTPVHESSPQSEENKSDRIASLNTTDVKRLRSPSMEDSTFNDDDDDDCEAVFNAVVDTKRRRQGPCDTKNCASHEEETCCCVVSLADHGDSKHTGSSVVSPGENKSAGKENKASLSVSEQCQLDDAFYFL